MWKYITTYFQLDNAFITKGLFRRKSLVDDKNKQLKIPIPN